MLEKTSRQEATMSEKQTKSGMTRRNFLRGSAAVGTGMLIVPSSYVFGGPTAPSNMITRAVIGTGGMGMGHVTRYPQTLAICDVDKNHLENAKRKAGGQVAAYSDWRFPDGSYRRRRRPMSEDISSHGPCPCHPFQ